MEFITKQEALQAVNKRIDELNTHEVFRRLKNDIDVCGVKKWIHEIKPTEAYTKEETITMLEEIKAEIDKGVPTLHLRHLGSTFIDGCDCGKNASINIIQERIEKLKR